MSDKSDRKTLSYSSLRMLIMNAYMRGSGDAEYRNRSKFTSLVLFGRIEVHFRKQIKGETDYPMHGVSDYTDEVCKRIKAGLFDSDGMVGGR